MAYKKCVICGEAIADENFVPYKQRYAHQRCFNIAVKTLQDDKNKTLSAKSKTKNKSKNKCEDIKDYMSEEEYKIKKSFFDYLRSLLKDEISAKIYTLSENYIKRYGFSYQEMLNTLIYMNEYKDIVLTGDIIGLIPYYYNEASVYFSNVENIDKKNENIDIKPMYQTKTVYINLNNKKPNKQIDITKI